MTSPRRPSSTGFTLLELMVVSLLMTVVTMGTAQMWRGFSASMTDLAARGRTAQELRFALEGIGEDFGSAVGATPVGGDRLLLCKDGGTDPNGLADWVAPDVTVEYYVSGGKLFRHDRSTDAVVALAENVAGFSVEDVTASVLRVVITVQRGNVARGATLLWSRP